MPPDDARARRRAAAVAGHTGDRAIAMAAITDPDARVRVAGLRSLDRLDELDTASLATALRDAESRVRITALELGARRPALPVAGLLDDPDPMVAEAAAWALGERPTTDAATIDALGRTAGHHADPLVREAAVAALGAIGDERGLAAILAATRDKPAIRRRAIVCLAPFDGPEVDAAYARARTDRDRQVRDAVEELLGPTS